MVLMMLIPTRTQCFSLMEDVAMPDHIRLHSLTVAEVARFLTARLNEDSVGLDPDLVDAGALLHDIAKGRCIRTGEDHAEVGGSMLREWGYLSIAPIVESHVHISEDSVSAPLNEAVIVNYADKRVRHDEIVTLEDRFHDLVARYGKSVEHADRIMKKLELFLRLEEKIFETLAIGPDAVLDLHVEM